MRRCGGILVLVLVMAWGLPGQARARSIQTSVTATGVVPTTGGSTEPTENEPNPPVMSILWKTPDAIKLQWSDRSSVETGFVLERQITRDQWEPVASFDPLPGNYLRRTHVLRGLEPEHDYCLRMVAYNAQGDSQDLGWSHDCTTTTAPGACDEKTMDRLLGLAIPGDDHVNIACDLTLEPSQVVTKQLRLIGAAASFKTIDLNGATLEAGPGTYWDGQDILVIRSDETDVQEDDEQISGYSRPEGIVVENGQIHGGVRVFGMAPNGQGDGLHVDYEVCTTTLEGNQLCIPSEREVPHTNQLKKSSHLADHTERARDNAPTDILLERLTIVGSGRLPLYVAPGVTHLTLENSWIRGWSKAEAIYLDTESGFNVIRGNSFDVDTGGHVTTAWDRPVIAIDSSSHNQIVDNHFSDLKNGGIFLYRNCGEGGVVRHETPSFNHIVNNVFYYVSYDGGNPAIFVASRNRGGLTETLNPWDHCGEDDGYPFGSSADDRDFARHNVVMQNQIYERSLDDAIQTRNEALNRPNAIFRNETVTPETVDLDRPADCTWGLEEGDFVSDGDSFDEMESSCQGTRFTCNDGTFIEEPIEALCAIDPDLIDGHLIIVNSAEETATPTTTTLFTAGSLTRSTAY